jgi:hypothetical protein
MDFHRCPSEVFVQNLRLHKNPGVHGTFRGLYVQSRLILRSRAQRGVSKDEAAPWFETRCFATLLTMRPGQTARQNERKIARRLI